MLLTANPDRKGAIVFNDSSKNLYLKLGLIASNASYTVLIPSMGYYELPLPMYTGQIDGIWSSAAGFARITELN